MKHLHIQMHASIVYCDCSDPRVKLYTTTHCSILLFYSHMQCMLSMNYTSHLSISNCGAQFANIKFFFSNISKLHMCYSLMLAP